MTRRIAALYLVFTHLMTVTCRAEVSPSAVGWGNLLVPGLGATLRGQPETGLLEATAEIGLFYGGTFGVREGGFTIDGSLSLPTSGSFYKPLLGDVMQEFGLKLHMWDTFYHYQQASLALVDSDREKYNSQPLYKGGWKDVMSSPFKADYLTSVWVFPLILVSSAYLVYDYTTSPLQKLTFISRPGEDGLYAFSQIGAIPLGSAFGEEPFFRGFAMREARLYTDSIVVSLVFESTLFTLIHPDDQKLSAFLSGLYFGLMTNHFKGDIGPAVAAHFWINVVSGITTYLIFKRVQGADTPFAPPLTASIQIPF